MRRPITLLVLLLALVADTAQALPAGEVITAFDGSRGVYVAMRASDGRELAVSCVGDLSHDGSRRFLRTDDHRLVVTDAACTNDTVLFTNPSLELRYARWSVDGQRVAVWAQSSEVVDQSRQDPPLHDAYEDPTAGIYVADIVTDTAGRPTGLVNLRQAIALPWTTWRSPVIVSWAGDGRRVTYGYRPATRNPDGTLTFGRTEVHVLDLDSGALTVLDENVTGSSPDFSPVPDPASGEYLIALTRPTRSWGWYRTDVFVVRPDGTGLRQVTSKNNVPAGPISGPHWSPDGQSLTFSAITSGSVATYHVWRIAADGRSKGKDLTPKATSAYHAQAWRP